MPQKRIFYILSLLLLFVSSQYALAQSSLGIGTNEAALTPTGPFAHLILWLNEQQRAFYLAMTNALKAMRESPWNAHILIGISFVYGVFHAAGPGHGKAVISSYMIANETALRRGILLSFISSLLQALMAIFVVGLGWFVLRGTGISINDTARFMEVASFGLIMLFGFWLLCRKLPVLIKGNPPTISPVVAVPETAIATSSLSTAAQKQSFGSAKPVRLNYSASKAQETGFDHAFVGSELNCAACGHAHMADPSQLSGDFNWKTAWSAIMAVGLRPCSGALIVLTFALLNGLVIGGLISVFAMAFGTFLTVAVLATLAVTAKNVVLKLMGHKAMSFRVQAFIEAGAALLITLVGALLFAAALLG
ncbi:ABC-type nickel/cobalt efflux system permease component RcnA [Paenochrobactrum gallinarii]|uniref:Nickel/cobalt efflux system n=1 Tax=Paenochrobactrum gallinarii TaxID=643673 RepID=A0A841M5S5_9HYPH|nr:nickel/cobalt transporter [Paenochrobactrum gallinarii]MBB6261498.1 ABC-type nickel/cobalt efflux system permease component RcnA [Paenochrobactrum gallinarii]